MSASLQYILLCFLESLSIACTNPFMRCFIWGLCIGVLMKQSSDPVQRMLANYQKSEASIITQQGNEPIFQLDSCFYPPPCNASVCKQR
eukprot:g11216.t1